MNAVYLSLGSNLGDRSRMIEAALDEIDRLDDTQLVRVSSLYDTDPVGDVDQPRFLNAVAMIETRQSPGRLLWNLKLIERRLGRAGTRRWGPRAIDVDILLYGEEVVDEPELQVPHPELAARAFVLWPLGELAPELEVPGTGKRVAELKASLGDRVDVRRLGRLSY